MNAARATALVLVLVGCGSSGSLGAASELGARVATAAVGAAASGSPKRRDSYEYRAAVARAKNQCAGANDRVRLVITDAASHLDVRSPDVVRFVRYADCQLDWLDGCEPRDGAAYAARWKTSGAEGARVIDVADEVDLYERLPGASLSLVTRVQRGARLHVELIGDTIRDTSLTYARSDLEPTEPCAHATHWVASVEHGALRVNVDPPPSLSERELDAQKELELGSYPGCRRGEPGTCEAAVALTLAPLLRMAAK